MGLIENVYISIMKQYNIYIYMKQEFIILSTYIIFIRLNVPVCLSFLNVPDSE